MLLRAFLPILFLLGSNITHASLFGNSETREQLEALRTKVSEMEARMQRTEEDFMGQSLIELHSQTEILKEELGRLRGQIEVLENENRSLRKQQKDFYLDLDNRLRQIEPKTATSALSYSETTTDDSPSVSQTADSDDTPPSSTPVILQLPDAAQRNQYDAVYTLFKDGDYSSAITGFERILSQYPQSALAPAAAYWIGNGHYAMRDFDKAIAAQQRLIETYPDSSKAPDGLLNMASSQIEIGQKVAAKKTLEKLITNYPTSEAAEKARRRLGSLK
jgi:tol-pal system protein YbgF